MERVQIRRASALCGRCSPRRARAIRVVVFITPSHPLLQRAIASDTLLNLATGALRNLVRDAAKAADAEVIDVHDPVAYGGDPSQWYCPASVEM